MIFLECIGSRAYLSAKQFAKNHKHPYNQLITRVFSFLHSQRIPVILRFPVEYSCTPVRRKIQCT